MQQIACSSHNPGVPGINLGREEEKCDLKENLSMKYLVLCFLVVIEYPLKSFFMVIQLQLLYLIKKEVC